MAWWCARFGERRQVQEVSLESTPVARDAREELQRLREHGETDKALVLLKEYGVRNGMLPDFPEGGRAWWDALEYLLDWELELRRR